MLMFMLQWLGGWARATSAQRSSSVSSSRCLSGNGKIIEKSAAGAEAGDADAILARPRKAIFVFYNMYQYIYITFVQSTRVFL
jgi:hypothetical protein